MASVEQVDSQAEKCLICEVPVSEIHLGINCCRACFVFYRRTKRFIAQHNALRCKEGEGQCTSKKPKAMCRKCRFERFTSVLSVCKEIEPTDIFEFDPPSGPPSSESSNHSTSSSGEIRILEKMKRAYTSLCAMRKDGEMAIYSPEINDKLQRGIIKYAPSTYSNVVPHARFMFIGLLDFFSSSFDDFRYLSSEKQAMMLHLTLQQIILFSCFELLNRSDDLYRAVHAFPDDDTLMPSYTTIFSIERMEEFLSDCPPRVNKQEASEMIIQNTKRHLLVNKALFKRMQLSHEEYLAFLGLALWKDHSLMAEDKQTEMAKKNRSVIMAELHRHYATQGRSDYSSRIGELLCLLASMEELAAQHKEDKQVYLLMDMFTEYVKVD